MKKNTTLLLIVALILIAGVIYILEKPTDSGIEQPPVTQSDDRKPKVGFLAPDFALKDYDGNIRTLADYKGKKVLLNFWAKWCPFCLEEMPLFEQFYQEFKDEGFEIVAINRGESLEVAKRYSDELRVTYPLLLDPEDQIYGRRYNGRNAMPLSFLLDEEGWILDIKFGFYLEEVLRADLKEHFGFGELTERVEFPYSEDEGGITDEELEDMKDESEDVTEKVISSTRPISVTNGVKHSVPLNAIRGGGPPKDGIPSIDNPKFISIAEADEYIQNEGLGIAFSFDGIDRFYPNQILVYHEIVNDKFGDKSVLVTYCPLCGTGIVFDPIVKGKGTEFGTSGKLWNSNLVMYDRQTDSYWSQALGESIVGEMTGTKLKLLPYDNMFYKDWKKQHPDGEVLSRETGVIRDYNRDPYGSYYTSPGVFFPVDYTDDRYHDKEPTWGVELNNQYKVYVLEELAKGPNQFTDEFAGETLTLSYDKAIRVLDIRRSDGSELVPFYGFWFSWISVHPETEVWTAP